MVDRNEEVFWLGNIIYLKVLFWYWLIVYKVEFGNKK
jgi:hypothetical protein